MTRTQPTRVWTAIAILAGSLSLPAALQAQVAPAAPPAPHQDAAVVTVTAAISQSRDALWLLDREARKLAVYRVDNAGLALVAVRDLKADFRCLEYSNEGRRQTPAVLQMKRAADAAAAKPAASGAAPPPPVDLTPQLPGSLLMTRAAYESGRDVVHVVDSSNRKLAVYTCDGRSLTLLHVRDLRVDLVPVEYDNGPPQSPTVGAMGALSVGPK
jgi:hypothetical protein